MWMGLRKRGLMSKVIGLFCQCPCLSIDSDLPCLDLMGGPPLTKKKGILGEYDTLSTFFLMGVRGHALPFDFGQWLSVF